jgi:thioredoxin reductase (NADPH)
MESIKCLIIGSGPAGYTAAIYASRANLQPVEYCGLQPGGQLTQTTEVENFPGYPEGVDGNQMMMDLRQQAERFGTDIRDGEIVSVDFSQRPYRLTDDSGRELVADTVIIATGASAKYLGLADEQKYMGQGVSACATCDGFFYRKKTVAVVGGGDTACEDALYLAGICKKVYLIVRKPYLRASKVMQQRVMEHENIEILFEHNTVGLFGADGVEGWEGKEASPMGEGLVGAHLVFRKGEADEKMVDIAIDGFFLAIGHKPNTEIFRQWLDTDEVGYLKKIDGTPRTKLPGIFVAGDCADPVYRQAITAAGTGCQAAIEAERYLNNL